MKKALITTFFLLAGACIAYFLVILGYSGIGTSFCGIWLLFAVLFIVMGIFTQRSELYRNGLPRLLPTFVFTTFGMGVVIFSVIMGFVVGQSHRTYSKVPDYCIVMGARVYPDGISKTLMYRLDKSCSVFEEYRGTKLVVAGGQERGDAVPEALAMYNYLIMKGVPGDRIMLQPHGTSTADIIARSLRMIASDADVRKIPRGPGDNVWAKDYTPSVGIITSDYHLLRSCRVARKQGVESPVPISAESDKVLFVHQCVRESLAFVKDLLMGNFTIDEHYVSFDRQKRN